MGSDAFRARARDPNATYKGTMRSRTAFLGALVTLIPLSAPGCVTKEAHQELQAELDKTRAELVGEQQAHAGAQRELERERNQLAALEQQIADLEKQLAEQKAWADGAVGALQSNLARVVKDRSALEASITEMESALEEARERKRQAEKRIRDYRELLAKFKPLIDSGRLQVKIVDGRMVVALSMDILFDSGSAQLSKDGAETVQQVTVLLASIHGKRYQVEGHTDTVPIRTKTYPSNWELGSARALSIVKTMVDAGMPADRVSGATFGEWRPAASNDTDDGKAQNRRIEIVILPDLSGLPGAAELAEAAS